jgi:8-oxo-dGTP diphosphatase
MMGKMAKEIIYRSAGITVDVVLFTIEEERLKVLLIERNNTPYNGGLALPGGFMQESETTEDAAYRILREKAGVKDIYIEQLYTFSGIRRDPRGRVISVTYFALVSREKIFFEGSDLQAPALFSVAKNMKLAFDHGEILPYAVERLRSKLEYTNVVYSLLKPQFTLTRLQRAYEIILGKKIDKRNFRKKYLSLGLIQETKNYERGGKQRPARLYQFKTKELSQLKKFF